MFRYYIMRRLFGRIKGCSQVDVISLVNDVIFNVDWGIRVYGIEDISKSQSKKVE